MSHIPSAAMPHAKSHDDHPVAPAAKPAARRPPWLAIVAGGALAIGTVVGAAAAARRSVKPARRRPTNGKPHRRKAAKD